MTDRLDPQARRFLDMLSLKSASSVADLDITGRRAAFANLLAFSAAGEEIAGVEDIAAARPMRLYRPRGGSFSALLFLHGGGLVAGSLETHDALCRTLTAASKCNVFALDYRLAPEHPFPAALDDTCGALTWIFEAAPRLGLTGVGIGGDSAGGTLAAVAGAQWRAQKTSRLAFQFLLCPILDFAGHTPSRDIFASPILDQTTLDYDIALYTQGRIAPDDPRISPLRAESLANLPPTFLCGAQCDPLYDEQIDYAARLRDADVVIHHTCLAGMPHLFYGITGVIPAAKDAFRQIGTEFGAWLTRNSQDG